MTNYSAHLKLKVQAEKKLAATLDNSVKSVGKEIYNMANESLAGAERALWYLSCITPGYTDVCRAQQIEDYRWFTSRIEVLRRDDVILDMVEIYFKRSINQLSQLEQKSLFQKIAKDLVKVATNHATDTLSENTLAYFLALAVLGTSSFREKIEKIIIKSAGYSIAGASFYGKIQLAALAARKLKNTHPEYYYDLYRNNIEMLYVLIEQPMSKILYLIDSGSDKEEEIVFLINDIVRKK